MGSQEDGHLEDSSALTEHCRRALGYLNFSSGQPDPQFLASLDALFAESSSGTKQPRWESVCDQLQDAVAVAQGSSQAFADVGQAQRVIEQLREFCPAYRAFHQRLLGHHADDLLFNSFFLGRAAEKLLQCQTDEPSSGVIAAAITQLSDYIGYRPVATLETQKIEPYRHEWTRPVPLYVHGAGSASGPYQDVVERTIQLLTHAEPALLRDAYFHLSKLEELAIDLRVYDFDHPANKRPNHHFGMWDPHHIDGDGFYRRFVVQQVTMDALLGRVDETPGVDPEELLDEAAAVLAGTILMSSGISGFGPETHDSTVSLSNLLGRIAAYRDAFYEQLITQAEGAHGARLRAEAERLRQPFGGARQDLNRQLTYCRAVQLQRVHLARIYARMDFPAAAETQVETILVASARCRTKVDCQLTEARDHIHRGTLAEALASIEAARLEVLEGIECGALVDPWNILGFDCNYGLFGGIENSIRDYRIDDLAEIVEEMLELYARVWGTAAAMQQDDVAEQTGQHFENFAHWWHQFAAHELDSIEAEDPLVVYAAAKDVAAALKAWQAQGEASGDIGFWAPHVQNFDSCRAYWLVINTLLNRDDKVAALGLLMHWLSQSEHLPLEHGEASFYALALQWLSAALDETGVLPADDSLRTGWRRIGRFFDYLEANAGPFWEVPQFAPEAHAPPRTEEESEETSDWGAEDEEEELYGAAYESVVYRDSTDDGMDGSIFDAGAHDEDYLQQASRPIVDRLAFLEQLASTWKLIAVAWTSGEVRQLPDALEPDLASTMRDLLQNARRHVVRTTAGLHQLSEAVTSYRLATPSGDPDSMEYYDRLRLLKDSLLDQIVNTSVCLVEAQLFLDATLAEDVDAAESDQAHGAALLRAALRGDVEQAKSIWPTFRDALESQPMLYVPLARGGNAQTIVQIKARQHLVQNLLHWLPRMGMLQETYELIELVRQMERLLPVGSGAITEFDDLFEVGCRAMVTALIEAKSQVSDEANAEAWLVKNLEEMMEPLLRSWLAHSRTLRLSVLEQVSDDEPWEELVEFIRTFGRDLFTQRFLNLGNLRGILHQGVDSWLAQLLEFGSDPQYQPLIDALEHDLDLAVAAEKLTLVLEAIVESYSEYRDYNSTTTQSDRGELLYTLLDFLRLRVSYDRVAWNLRPVVLAHKVLAEQGCDAEAEQWRQSLRTRIRSEAQRHMKKLQLLQHEYAMNLPSISKRLSEKFMRPLLIDFQCALVKPSMTADDPEERESAFGGIVDQANTFMQEPSGAGLDVPAWLLALEDTVQAVKNELITPIYQTVEARMLPPQQLSTERIEDTIRAWHEKDDD